MLDRHHWKQASLPQIPGKAIIPENQRRRCLQRSVRPMGDCSRAMLRIQPNLCPVFQACLTRLGHFCTNL